MIPSQISWHLSWSDLLNLLQNLHTSICVQDQVQRVIFAGSNRPLQQNLHRIWQQLGPAQALETTAIPIVADVGVLIVASQLRVGLQLQPIPTGVECPLPADCWQTGAIHWQTTLILDQALINQLFAGLEDAAPDRLHVAAQEHFPPAPQILQACWQHFLQLSEAPPSVAVPAPAASRSPLCQPLFQQLPLGVFQAQLDGSLSAVNPAFCQLTGYSETELRRLDLQCLTAADDCRTALELIQQVVHYQEPRIFAQRFRRADGSLVWAEVKVSLVGDREADAGFLLGFVTDLSDRRQIEAERLHAFQEIQQRQEQTTLLNNIAVRIRSAIDLPTMLQNAAAELNHALLSDRVVIYQFMEEGGGRCVSEAVHPLFARMQGQHFGADCIPPPYLEAYRTGRLWSVDDVAQAQLTECHQQMLQQVQVKSMVATGILSMDDALKPNQRRLWGLLAVHQCQTQRQWTSADLQLVEAVANQLAIALEQTKLLSRLTRYTCKLEDRVRQRTKSLERSLRFEQFIRSLTECLYREFDENHLFGHLVRGLVSTLGVDVCLISRYNSKNHTLEVKFEAFSPQIPKTITFLGHQLALANLPIPFATSTANAETYYFNGNFETRTLLLELAQFSAHFEATDQTQFSQIVRPIMGVESEMGMVIVLQLRDRTFAAAEVELVEQATNYCAIALRQAHLYRQEHEQRLSAEYLRSFLEKSIDMYVEYDAELRYTAINPAGCALLRRPRQQIIGKTNQELLPAGNRALEQVLQQAVVTAEKVFINHEIRLPDGCRMFESVYAPITDPNGEVQRVIGVCRDITEFKQQWQLLETQNHQLTETTRLKQEFVATTSHELRTPLTAILGFSNVLLQGFAGALNPRQQEYMERIYASGEHLLELINDILDLSRLEAGRMELNLQLIHIVDICEAVTSLLQEQASSQGLRLEVELAPETEWIVADPRRLKQMLLNLLINAIKFTPAGAVGLKIYCDPPLRSPSLSPTLCPPFSNAPAAPWIHFVVWDTGIGISEADQRSLFQPFSQVDSSLDRQHQGSGLGLVITQKLAELHGGWVSLQSTLGEGTQLTIALPLGTASSCWQPQPLRSESR